nr:hypothetical protein [uncultured Anaerosporobacter sp.]
MTKMISLRSNICGERYNQLIDTCFDLSTHFSFTKRSFHKEDEVYKKFMEDLTPSYRLTLFASHWFCYYVSRSTPLEIYVFSTDNNMKQIIKGYFDNLFQQERNLDGTWGNIKNLPEDLCFFTGNKLLLGTVSHEDICYVYPPTKEIASQFIKLGNWEEKNYLPDEHIHIEI